MDPIIISLMAFLAVSALIGLVAYAFRGNDDRAADRLDTLVGKRKKDDPGAEILRRTAFDSDKKSILEWLTPNLPSLNRIFEQADCHIKPSTLFGISLLLAALGATGSWLARVPWFFMPAAALVMFVIPFLWLLNKRRVRLNTSA